MTVQDNQELLLIKRKLSRRSPSNTSSPASMSSSPATSSQSLPNVMEKQNTKSFSNEKRLYHIDGDGRGGALDAESRRLAEQAEYERKVRELSALRDRPPTRNELVNTNYSLDDPDERVQSAAKTRAAAAERQKSVVGTKSMERQKTAMDREREEQERLEKERLEKEKRRREKEAAAAAEAEEKRKKEEEKRRKEKARKQKEEEEERRRREEEEEEEEKKKMREDDDDDDDEDVVQKKKEENTKKGNL